MDQNEDSLGRTCLRLPEHFPRKTEGKTCFRLPKHFPSKTGVNEKEKSAKEPPGGKIH